MTEDSDISLFDRIGGEEAIARLVGAFYQRVLADPELGPFFMDVSIEKLRNMQLAFFAEALGGPIRYTGRSLAAVHAGRGIGPRHVRRFLEHLLATLEVQGESLDPDERYEVYSRIARRADEITGTTGVDG